MTDDEIRDKIKAVGSVEVMVGVPDDLNALNREIKRVVKIGQDMGCTLIEGYVNGDSAYIVHMAKDQPTL